MKLLSQLKFLTLLFTFCTITACSKSDDSNDQEQNQNPLGENYIKYSVIGSAVSGDFYISSFKEPEASTIVGYLNTEETDLGTVEVATLIFSRSDMGANYRDVTMSFTPAVGAYVFEEVITNSTGMITNEPISYDSDNDMDNDIITHLLSKNMTITILEYEEVTNSFGLLTIGHVKGSFEGTGYYKAYTGPTSEPELLLHTFSGEFEYNLPSE